MDFNTWLQSRLTAHGFPVGPVDGVLTDVTFAALRRFQVAKGLDVSGKVDRATEAALRESSSVVPNVVKMQIPDREAMQSSNAAVPVIANRWPNQANAMAFYGPVGTGQTKITLPFDMVLAWDKSVTVRQMSLHTKVAASAARVFDKVAAIYGPNDRKSLGLDVFGGSLNVRRKRGGTSYSMHSWGIAIDFDPERNQLQWGKPQARLSHDDAIPFWKAWEAEGWLSLGRARNFDWMHIQAAVL